MNLVAVTFKSLIVCDGSFPQKVVFILYLVLHFSKFHVYADNKGRGICQMYYMNRSKDSSNAQCGGRIKQIKDFFYPFK